MPEESATFFIFAFFVLFVFFIVLGIIIKIIQNAIEKKRIEEIIREAENSKKLRINITDSNVGASAINPVEAAKPSAASIQKSLDSIYAEASNLWVCETCETLNVAGRVQCIACGHDRKG